MNILKKIKGIVSRTHTLNESERIEMRDSFVAFMETRPMPKVEPLLRTSFFALMTNNGAVYGGTFALLIATSIAYAAEGSLPNESLYAVKRHVTENMILTSTLMTPGLHARAEHMMLERRLEEVSLLAKDDALETDIAHELASEITDHSDALHAYVTEATALGNLEEALEVGLDTESVLGAHETVLTVLTAGATEQEQALSIILDSEQDRFEAQNRQTKTAITESADSETTVNEVLETQTDAKEALADVLETLNTTPPSEPDIADEVRELIIGAQDSYEEGTTQGPETSLSETYITLHESMQQVTEASLLLETDQDLTAHTEE